MDVTSYIPAIFSEGLIGCVDPLILGDSWGIQKTDHHDFLTDADFVDWPNRHRASKNIVVGRC